MKDAFIVAVTCCPSGVAHTYMAAEALERAAKKRGIRIKVETQSSMGTDNAITQAEVAAASAVILTKDIQINHKERFQGKPTVSELATKIVMNPDKIIDAALQMSESAKG